MTKLSKVNQFIVEVNKELTPLLVVERETDGVCLQFRLRLPKNKYVMRNEIQVGHSGLFEKLITDKSNEILSESPTFNNTGRIFWFTKLDKWEN